MLGLASGLFAITALVLVEKSRMHSLVERIQSQTLEAGARFAVLALVILPLLPAGPYGPDPGFRPWELWALVLIFAGLSFAGYLALRITGPAGGYGLAGMFGGLISSTVVSLNFSRESREQPAFGRPLALGVIAACMVLPIRTGLLAGALNADVARRALPFLLIPTAVGFLMAAACSGAAGAVREAADAGQPAASRGGRSGSRFYSRGSSTRSTGCRAPSAPSGCSPRPRSSVSPTWTRSPTRW
jgi:uncharacterized membrane protein (DUF4010 family)